MVWPLNPVYQNKPKYTLTQEVDFMIDLANLAVMRGLSLNRLIVSVPTGNSGALTIGKGHCHIHLLS